jgi:hypothetical protein
MIAAPQAKPGVIVPIKSDDGSGTDRGVKTT